MKFIVTFSEIPVKHCGNKKKVVAVILVVGGVVGCGGGVVVVVGGGGGSMCTKYYIFLLTTYDPDIFYVPPDCHLCLFGAPHGWTRKHPMYQCNNL